MDVTRKRQRNKVSLNLGIVSSLNAILNVLCSSVGCFLNFLIVLLREVFFKLFQLQKNYPHAILTFG